jgi:hypothetical protein
MTLARSAEAFDRGLKQAYVQAQAECERWRLTRCDVVVRRTTCPQNQNDQAKYFLKSLYNNVSTNRR